MGSTLSGRENPRDYVPFNSMRFQLLTRSKLNFQPEMLQLSAGSLKVAASAFAQMPCLPQSDCSQRQEAPRHWAGSLSSKVPATWCLVGNASIAMVALTIRYSGPLIPCPRCPAKAEPSPCTSGFCRVMTLHLPCGIPNTDARCILTFKWFIHMLYYKDFYSSGSRCFSSNSCWPEASASCCVTCFSVCLS